MMDLLWGFLIGAGVVLGLLGLLLIAVGKHLIAKQARGNE